jgi:hypothetical protein
MQSLIANEWKSTLTLNRVTFLGPFPTNHNEIVMMDVRPSQSQLRLDCWENDLEPGEAEWEPGIALIGFAVVLKRKSARGAFTAEPSLKELGNASRHAIGRRVERGGGTMLQAVADMRSIEPWSRLAASAGCDRFVAPTTTGHWAGDLIYLHDDFLDRDVRDLCARTWISSDDTYDEGTAAAMQRLREIGPRDGEAMKIMQDLIASQPKRCSVD